MLIRNTIIIIMTKEYGNTGSVDADETEEEEEDDDDFRRLGQLLLWLAFF